jgi:beta-1,4-mannosyltransferase
MVDLSARGLRVLAWPGPSQSQSNPYTSLVYGEFEKAGFAITNYSIWKFHGSRADIFHIHWPEAILWGRLARHVPLTTELAARRVLDTMDVIHRNGGTVVWTAHNVSPHALSSQYHERVWGRFFPQFRRKVDALIGLTSRSLDLICDAYPDLRQCSRFVVPHPHYRTVYPVQPSRRDARAAIGLAQGHFVLAMIGTIRRGKGVTQAVQVFRKIRKENEVLFISGQCSDPELAADIQSATGNDSGVIFQNRYLPDAELVYSFAAADAVLINQSATLNSGTLLLALSMNRPTIAPAKGSIVELAESVGAGWISTFSSEVGPDALRDCLDAIQGHDRGGQAPLDRFDPEAVSRATMAVLVQILATRRSTNSAVTPSAALETAPSIGGARITAASIRPHHNVRDRKWGRQ